MPISIQYPSAAVQIGFIFPSSQSYTYSLWFVSLMGTHKTMQHVTDRIHTVVGGAGGGLKENKCTDFARWSSCSSAAVHGAEHHVQRCQKCIKGSRRQTDQEHVGRGWQACEHSCVYRALRGIPGSFWYDLVQGVKPQRKQERQGKKITVWLCPKWMDICSNFI